MAASPLNSPASRSCSTAKPLLWHTFPKTRSTPSSRIPLAAKPSPTCRFASMARPPRPYRLHRRRRARSVHRRLQRTQQRCLLNQNGSYNSPVKSGPPRRHHRALRHRRRRHESSGRRRPGRRLGLPETRPAGLGPHRRHPRRGPLRRRRARIHCRTHATECAGPRRSHPRSQGPDLARDRRPGQSLRRNGRDRLIRNPRQPRSTTPGPCPPAVIPAQRSPSRSSPAIRPVPAAIQEPPAQPRSAPPA